MTATHNITVTIGTTFGPIKFVCKDSACDPVDLTGWSVWAEVRTSPAGPVVVNLSPSITNAAGGEITISATDNVTATWKEGSYKWDLVLQDTGVARPDPPVAGSFKIERKTITQPPH